MVYSVFYNGSDSATFGCVNGGSVAFRRGLNEVSADDLAALEGNPVFDELVRNGDISVVGKSESPSSECGKTDESASECGKSDDVGVTDAEEKPQSEFSLDANAAPKRRGRGGRRGGTNRTDDAKDE